MSSTKSTTHFWTDEMTRFMLDQVKELNILKFMDGRKTRNAYLFKKICTKMREAGFVRTPEQIRIKWKNTRKAYNAAMQNNARGGRERISCPYFEQMEDLFGGRPLSKVGQQENGVDIGFEEVDDETTEMGEETTTGALDEPEEDSPRSAESRRSTSPLPETSAPPPRRRRQGNPDITLICQEMARNRAFWKQQMKESDERQERLLRRIMADSNAASSAMMAALLEGLKSLAQTATPSHATPHASAVPGPSRPACANQTADIVGSNPGKTRRLPADESNARGNGEGRWSGVEIRIEDCRSSQEDSGQAPVKEEEPIRVKTEEDDDQKPPVSSAAATPTNANALSETPCPQRRRLELQLKDVKEEETGDR